MNVLLVLMAWRCNKVEACVFTMIWARVWDKMTTTVNCLCRCLKIMALALGHSTSLCVVNCTFAWQTVFVEAFGSDKKHCMSWFKDDLDMPSFYGLASAGVQHQRCQCVGVTCFCYCHHDSCCYCYLIVGDWRVCWVHSLWFTLVVSMANWLWSSELRLVPLSVSTAICC